MYLFVVYFYSDIGRIQQYPAHSQPLQSPRIRIRMVRDNRKQNVHRQDARVGSRSEMLGYVLPAPIGLVQVFATVFEECGTCQACGNSLPWNVESLASDSP